MSNKKNKRLGVIRSGILKAKLITPTGVTLTARESREVIDLMQDDKKTVDDNHKSLVQAELRIKRNQNTLPEILKEVRQAKTEATRFFKITKDPIKRREWARRLVVADRAAKSVQASEKRMNVMLDRVKTLVMDAALESKALEVRVNEATAYHEMGKGLTLVGESLVNARTRAKSMKVEFDNLEIGIEGLNRMVSAEDDNRILAEAKEIIGDE